VSGAALPGLRAKEGLDVSANPGAPGAIGFMSMCPECRRPFTEVRVSGGVFRWTEHQRTPPAFTWAPDPAPERCSKSDTRWEPEPAGAGFEAKAVDDGVWTR